MVIPVVVGNVSYCYVFFLRAIRHHLGEGPPFFLSGLVGQTKHAEVSCEAEEEEVGDQGQPGTTAVLLIIQH